MVGSFGTGDWEFAKSPLSGQAARTLERFLTREGFAVSTAANANEGLLAVQVDQPEIVLTDIYMPGMTGLELQARVRDFAPEINVLLMTGQDDMLLEAAINGQADALVTYNIKDFAEAGDRFRISVLRPGDLLKKVKA